MLVFEILKKQKGLVFTSGHYFFLIEPIRNRKSLDQFCTSVRFLKLFCIFVSFSFYFHVFTFVFHMCVGT